MTARTGLRRRWLIGGIVAALIVALGIIVVRSIVLRDRARVVPAEEALDDFRDEVSSTVVEATTAASTSTTQAPAALAPPLAEPGIYRYRTTGSEEIDALDGATHEYPAETTMTVVQRGCGVEIRWDALRERRDQWALCSTLEGIELQRDGVQYHEFFGQPNEEALSCDRAVLVVPVTSTATTVTQQSCMLADDPWLPRWQILERSTRSVDATEVSVQHVRMTIDDNDEYWEHLVVDWYLADTGLPVEITATKESASPSPIGSVTYREQYRLELVSTIPLQ